MDGLRADLATLESKLERQREDDQEQTERQREDHQEQTERLRSTLESKLEGQRKDNQEQIERFRSEMAAQRAEDKELRRRNFAGLLDQVKTVMENYDPL